MKFEMIKPELLPPKMIVHSSPGWGKTSLASFAKGAFMMMSPLETGYKTLVGVGSVPVIPSVVCETWADVVEMAKSAAADEECKTIVFDALGGFEKLSFDAVLKERFGGDRLKFLNYYKGPEMAVQEWAKLLAMLEASRKTIVMLAHTTVKEKKTPDLEPFSYYGIDLYRKLWLQLDRWADAVLFGKFDVVLDMNTGKPMGGSERVMITAHSAYCEVKNRYGMPDTLPMDVPVDKMWGTLSRALTANSAKNKEEK